MIRAENIAARLRLVEVEAAGRGDDARGDEPAGAEFEAAGFG